MDACPGGAEFRIGIKFIYDLLRPLVQLAVMDATVHIGHTDWSKAPDANAIEATAILNVYTRWGFDALSQQSSLLFVMKITLRSKKGCPPVIFTRWFCSGSYALSAIAAAIHGASSARPPTAGKVQAPQRSAERHC